MARGDDGLGLFVAGARIVVVLNHVVTVHVALTGPMDQVPVPTYTATDKTKEESFFV